MLSRVPFAAPFGASSLFVATALVCPLQVLADQPQLMPPVVSSATLIPTPVDQLGNSVTVITADEIEAKQARTFHDVLFDAPGLAAPSYGGPGTSLYLFLRGTNTNHTKVMVDGVPINSTAAGDTPNAEQILPAEIERVEILRGPQSGLWGADAIGGVINIITRQGKGPLQATATIEGGSYDTFNQSLRLAGATDRFAYAVTGAHYSAQSMRVTPDYKVPNGQTPLNYATDNRSLSGKFGVDVSDSIDLGLTARMSDGHLDYSDNDSTLYVHSHQYNRQYQGRFTAHQTVAEDVFEHTLGLDASLERMNGDNPPYVSFGTTPWSYGSQRLRADWQGRWTVISGETLVFGAESQREWLTDRQPSRFEVRRDNHAGFVELNSALTDYLGNSVSVRHDQNEQFGGHDTFRVAPVVTLAETGTLFKASLGTGFKPPSLAYLGTYQSLGTTYKGNPDLRPETNLGFDLGAEQKFAADSLRLGTTYFKNYLEDLVSIRTVATNVKQYFNVTKATTWGLENFVEYRPARGLTLRADYTYLATVDANRSQLVERPKHKISLRADWAVTQAISLTAETVTVSNWYAYDYTKGSGFTTANLAGSYQIDDGVRLFARLNNLFDRTYAEQTDYLAERLGVFGGLTVTY